MCICKYNVSMSFFHFMCSFCCYRFSFFSSSFHFFCVILLSLFLLLLPIFKFLFASFCSAFGAWCNNGKSFVHFIDNIVTSNFTAKFTLFPICFWTNILALELYFNEVPIPFHQYFIMNSKVVE